MAYHAGAIEASLSAALGDDAALIADLRQAFFESARRHVEALDRAESESAIRDAACRLRSLAASFGTERLMRTLDPVIATGEIGDADRRRIERALAMLATH